MKYLLMSLALAAGSAMACPGDDAKNATAPAVGKDAAATSKAMPAAARSAATAPASKPAVKVAAKPATEARKTAPL